MKELSKAYKPQETEDKIYKLWAKSGFFNPDALLKNGTIKREAKPFSIVLPPPNVTGTLHMGHAAMLVVEDILIRYHRMKGDKTLWLPGTDHAAIATESKVEQDLYKKLGKTRHDLGRKKFLDRVNQFAKESHDTIVHQVKKMGASLDWSREAYTLDDKRSLAVRTAFKRMYDAGLVYRGDRIVNWDPKMQTTVSDDEVEWKEEQSSFYYLKYGPFTIGTARPETKFGDKYVVMHPKDKRYTQYKQGEKIELEWINGKITATIIKDSSVDMQFGTGVMTITPWHDRADFEIAECHNLEKEQIIDQKGKLLPIAGEFTGQHILKVRPLIVEKLQRKGLVEKIDKTYTHRIATNSRGGGIIEPQIMRQWFVDVTKEFLFPHAGFTGVKKGQKTTLKKLMLHVVKTKQIEILPKRFEKTYFHWIENLRDWCISRQIWFGHQIPVWYCGDPKKSILKIGFAKDVIPQVSKGKTKTYRLRDHGFKIGDKVLFENSHTKTYFGYGIITNIQEMRVDEINYKDKTHYKTYLNLKELIAAFKLRNPDKKVSPESKAYLYAYEFHTFAKKDSDEGCGQTTVSIDKPKQCPACKSTKLTQDPDTLDTWFSSGLWTFSTLGWPEKTNDLKTYHPTSVLETGYDILFFWVARMILMSTYLMGEIPFRTVYLHGLVRDEKGRKMSKSLGNVIDPLTMVEKYGADATRLSLIIGAAPGNDLKLSEDRVRGYRNFANKLWNIARFVQMNTTDYPSTSLRASKGKLKLSAKDRKILSDFVKTKKQVTKLIEEYRLAQAAETLYHYAWHTFADKVLEDSKKVLSPFGRSPEGRDEMRTLRLRSEQARGARQYVLLTILKELLSLLHPFTPFVTEELYQQLFLKDKKKMLMIAKWPVDNLTKSRTP